MTVKVMFQQHVPFQAWKPLLHSYPFGKAMITKDPSHSDALTRLHWQLALEEKSPGTSIVQYPCAVLRWSTVLSPVLAGLNDTWITEPRMKASTESLSFPFCCIEILVKGHAMLKKQWYKQNTHYLYHDIYPYIMTLCPFMKDRSMWCQKVNSAFIVLHQVVAWMRLQDSGNASCCIAHAAMQAQKQLTHSTAHTGKRQDQITKKNKEKNRSKENKNRGYCLWYLKQHSRC